MKKDFIRFISCLVFCSLICCAAGCSSSARSSSGQIYYQDISVETEPSGATVRIGTKTKLSPATFKVKKSVMNLEIEVEKDGYMPVRRVVKPEVTWGGALFHNEKDYMSGKVFYYSPSSLDFDLVKLKDAKHKNIAVWVRGLGAVPNVVSPGAEFGFWTKYKIVDNTVLDEKVPVELGFAIKQGAKILYQDSRHLNVPRGKDYITEKKGLRAGPVPGRYTLELWVKYKDKENRLATKLDVR